tara:strand:+ start:108622 stop:110013 length:1392 start_codon:yes stop_codon:yes gene_type:complete
MTNVRKTIFILLVLIISPQLNAQSLLDVYEKALRFDPTIKVAEANYLAILELKPQAMSYFFPSLTLSTYNSRSDSKDMNPIPDYRTGSPIIGTTGIGSLRETTSISLNLSQTIFDMRSIVGLSQTNKRLAQAEALYNYEKQNLLLRVSEAYFNVLAAKDILIAQQTAKKAIGRQLDLARSRFELGLIAITDVQESQAGYDLAVASEIEAERLHSSSKEFLREITGEYIEEPSSPKNNMPLENPTPDDIEEWVKMSLDQNLSLISSKINERIAQDSIKIQRGTRFPVITLSGNINESNTDVTRSLFCIDENTCPVRVNSKTSPEGYNIALNVNFPIFTGGFNSSKIRQAVYEHRAAKESTESIARQTERLTRDSFLGVITEISKVKALTQAVESSKTALVATEAGFEVGTRTAVDVLVSQNSLAQAETNLARSKYDYILNILKLSQSVGSLSIDDLNKVNEWLD